METREIQISAPKLEIVQVPIRGTAPLVMGKMGQEAKEKLRRSLEAGSTNKMQKKKEPRDFQREFEQCLHVSDEGWYGIPATAFRSAMISACRTVGYVMTRAKLAFSIKPDGFDREDAMPLIRITKGEPHKFVATIKTSSGDANLSVRAQWLPGWEAAITIIYDTEMLTSNDIANLMLRVGAQVGIGSGRPDSPKSAGQGWGLFEIIQGG